MSLTAEGKRNWSWAAWLLQNETGSNSSTARSHPMKTFGITCGGFLGILCSLAALSRYWLIMTFGLGFSDVSDDRLAVGANAALLAGIVGLLLSVGILAGYPFFLRRAFFSRRPLPISPAGLRSA
jgi:hypothetical protein